MRKGVGPRTERRGHQESMCSWSSIEGGGAHRDKGEWTERGRPTIEMGFLRAVLWGKSEGRQQEACSPKQWVMKHFGKFQERADAQEQAEAGGLSGTAC